MSKDRVAVGLSHFHYAILTEDSEESVSYETPKRVRNITEANVNFNSEVGTFHADDGPRIAYSQIGNVEVELTVGDIPPEDYAELIGADYEDGVVKFRSTSSAPDVAIGFRSQMSNGEYRYIWIYKGKFGVPEMAHQTKADSVEFQPQTINFTGLARQYDDAVFKRADSNDESVDADLIDNWFEDPDYEPNGGGA